MTASHRQTGFTLVELLTVMVIVGILAAVAIPRFAESATRQRVDAAARRLVADITLARRHAYQANVSQAISFDVLNDSYRLNELPDPDHPGQDYVVNLGDEPYRVQIVSLDFSGKENVTFDPYGMPNRGGTVVIAMGNWTKTVNIDPDTGEASLP